jgi:type II secretory ATPase GspE/PulE/Tfp pilus assembly ATPase PilB-like protein
LSYLNDGKRKIITLEDPIEYEVKGIQQSQINYSKGYTYEI